MKKFLLCGLLIGLVPTSHATSFKFERDKALHFGVSAGLGGIVTVVSHEMGYDSRWIDYGACMSFGLAKEALDERRYGGWSNYDLAYDGLGCIVGIETTRALRRWLPEPVRFSLTPSIHEVSDELEFDIAATVTYDF